MKKPVAFVITDSIDKNKHTLYPFIKVSYLVSDEIKSVFVVAMDNGTIINISREQCGQYLSWLCRQFHKI